MEAWKKCSSCKTPLAFGEMFYACSVSTCNKKRTKLVFCSVPCWEAHLPLVRHREAWALDERAPTQQAWADLQRQQATSAAKASPRVAGAPRVRKVVGEPVSQDLESDFPVETLIVVSKLKKYIKARSGMNTSDTVLRPLSKAVRELCDKAILEARKDGRKTVMDRDFD